MKTLADFYILIIEMQRRINGNCRISFMGSEGFLQIGITWEEGLVYKEKIDLLDIFHTGYDILNSPQNVLIGLFVERANKAYAEHIKKNQKGDAP